MTGFDGELWIKMVREKTQKNIAVPLLPKAKKLINKHTDENSKEIFKICSNQRYNSYLKEIASILGINKRLTTHIARKIFATTVTLSRGVPIETVSKMLGHTNLSTTQHYAKVLDLKVSRDMLALKERESILGNTKTKTAHDLNNI